MNHIHTSSNNNTFEVQGRGIPFFWLGDTCWSAPWKASWKEWTEYVGFRAKQGFNMLQLCSIPYDETSNSKYLARIPFDQDENGCWNFDNPQMNYFNFLRKMVDYANQEGFVVAVVLLWWNYIPNARLWTHPMPRPVMSLSQAKNYIRFIVDLLKDNSVVWILTGDDTFYGDGVLEFDREMGSFLKQYDTSNRMITVHPSISSAKFFSNEPWMDFYMIQSSHFDSHQNLAYELSYNEFCATPPKPVVNAEICYEWHKGFDYGHRFNRKDIRRAFWWSVLEGSLAGITYGAEGIFNWIGDNEIEENNNTNIWISWDRAMRNPGAEDVVRAKKLLEQIEWYKLRPASHRIIKSPARHVSCAASDDTVVVYIPPYMPPTEGLLELDLDGIPAEAIARWWNPASGQTEILGSVTKTMRFVAPDKRDSVLVIGKYES